MTMASDVSTEAKRVIPLDAWIAIAAFVEQPQHLAVTSRDLQRICQEEAKRRVFRRCGVTVVNPSQLSRETVDFIRLLGLPKGKSSIIPCIRVSLSGKISARLLYAEDGPVLNLMDEFERVSGNSFETHIFSVICDHAIETTLEPSTTFRGMFLKRCGVVAYETAPNSSNMKRIEVQLRGKFGGKQRLFGIPLIIVVPRIVDRNFVHQTVWKRLAPLIRNAESYPLPPYKLVAYNISAVGVWNEVAFTPDYMVVDSQMHAVGERFTLIVDFDDLATDIVKFEVFGDAVSTTSLPSFVPMKSIRLVARLVERDCGVRI